jgi:AraC-like DNA-binding protein
MRGKSRRAVKIKHKMRMLVIMTIITMIPTIVLGIYAYMKAAEGVEKEIQQANEQVLVQVQYKTEEILRGVEQGYRSINNDPRLVEALETPLDYTQYSIWKDLMEVSGIHKTEGMALVRDYVRNVYIVNYEKDWVTTNYGVFQKVELDIQSQLDKWFEGPKNVEWIKEASLEDVFATLIIRLPLYGSQYKQMIVVNVDERKVLNDLKHILGSQYGIIINEYNQVIYTNLPEEIEYGLEEGSYHFTQIKAQSNGWTYKLVYAKEDVIGNIRPISNFILIICTIIVGIAVLISELSLKRAYKPFVSIFQSLKLANEEENEEEACVEYIFEGVNRLIYKNQHLTNEVKEQLKRIEELFLFKLVKGDVSQYDFMEYKEILTDCQRCNELRLLIFEVQNTYTGIEQDMNMILLAERIKKELKEDLVYSLTLGSQVVILIGTKEDALLEDAERVIEAVANKIHQEYNYQLKITISREISDMMKVSSLYKECVDVLRRQVLGEKPFEIIDYKEFTKQTNTEEVTYPQALEDDILNEIILHNKEGVQDKIKHFVEHVDRQSMQAAKRYYTYVKLVLAMLELAKGQNIEIEEVQNNQLVLEVPYHMLERKKVIKNLVEGIALPIIEELERSFESGKKQLMLELDQIIAQECTNDITLKECAYRLNYHPSYIWRVMKEEKNTTFSEYVLEQRLRAAKKMLLQTELSIKDISEQLKYNNSQNFIRYFKKLEGVTPGEYRKINKTV